MINMVLQVKKLWHMGIMKQSEQHIHDGNHAVLKCNKSISARAQSKELMKYTIRHKYSCPNQN